jgi:adenylate cyclase
MVAPMPGVEIHASAADTIINGNWVRPAAPWIPLVMAVIFSMLMGVLTGAMRPVKALPLGWLPLMALANVITFAVFWRSNLWVPSMHVMIGITLTYVFMTIYLELTAQKQERQLRQAWARRVAPEVLEMILENPGLASVEGRLVHATVFFSDLRRSAITAGRCSSSSATA